MSFPLAATLALSYSLTGFPFPTASMSREFSLLVLFNTLIEDQMAASCTFQHRQL